MSDSGQLVRDYLEVIGRREVDAVRPFLADSDFSYTSPIGTYDDADSMVTDIERFAPIMDTLTIRKLLADDREVMALIDVTISLQEYMTRTAALLFRVEGDRIQTIEALFDASEYFRMFESGD